MKNVAWFMVLFSLVFALFAPNASAYYDTGLALSSEKVSGCPGNAIPVVLTITNADDVTHTYFLSLEMPEGWESPDNGFIQPDITLSSGETDSLTFFVNPPAVDPGVYSLRVRAKNGEEAYKDLDVEVLQCHYVSVHAEDMINICEETDFKYSFSVSNAGKEAEEFGITVSGSWGEDLYKDTLTIGSGGTEEIEIDVTSPTEDGKITVKAESTESYAKTEKVTELDVKKCFDFDASIEPTEASSCLGRAANFIVTVINKGSATDTYDITSPDWVVPSQESLMVLPGEERDLGLFAYPEIEGKTEFEVTVSSSGKLSMKETLKGTVDARECKGVAVIVIPASQEVCRGLEAEFTMTVKNTGTVADVYDLETDLGVFDKNKLDLEVGEIGEAKITVDTEDLDTGESFLTARATSGDVTDQNMVSLIVKECYSAEFALTPDEIDVCAGEEVDYTLVLKNTGEFEDEYAFVLDEEEIGTTSLAPGEMKTFTTKVKVDYPEGEYDLIFKAVSDHVSEEASSKITVESKETCYSFEISSGETEAYVDPGKGIALGVKIKNNGERADIYALVVEGPEWVYLSEDSVALESGEETYIYLYASPGYDAEEKVHMIKLMAESSVSRGSLEISMGVGIESCPENDTGNISGEITIPTGEIVQITGTTGKVILLAVIVLLIIVILAVKFVLFVK